MRSLTRRWRRIAKALLCKKGFTQWAGLSDSLALNVFLLHSDEPSEHDTAAWSRGSVVAPLDYIECYCLLRIASILQLLYTVEDSPILQKNDGK